MMELGSRHFQVVIGPIVDPAPDVIRRFPKSTCFSSSRRSQFLTGRMYAERAIANIGGLSTVVGVGVDRAPIWPDGVRGSISHTDRLCVVIVGKVPVVEAVGIDIEYSGAVTDELVPMVCREEEHTIFSDPTVIFSAKEAYYKAWYSQTGRFLDFSDLEVRTLPNSRIGVSLLKAEDRPAFPRELLGYHTCIGRHIVVGLAFTRDSVAGASGEDSLADIFTALQKVEG